MLFTYINLVRDYNGRNRALHQLIREIKLRMAQRRETIFDKHKTDKSAQGWFATLTSEDNADKKLLACLEDLWSLSGMDVRSNRRQLRSNRYLQALGRLEEMLNNVYMKTLAQDQELADDYWTTIQYVQALIAELSWTTTGSTSTQPPSESLSFFDNEPEPIRPELMLAEQPTATDSDDELDIPAFMSDDFQPSGA